MSQYFCSIVDVLCVIRLNGCTLNLGEYRYGLTVVGDGEPIVCFHGFSESSYARMLLIFLDINVIRIDLIGHGDSDIPDEDKAYTIPRDRSCIPLFIIW